MPEIENADELYRSLRPWDIGTDGKVKSTAFNDKEKKQPSVDQAKLRTSPEESKLNPEDGIALLVAGEIRNIAVSINGDGEPNHHIDVVPDPVEPDDEKEIMGNPAHAIVVATPGFLNDSRFKRLKHALSLLANVRPRVIEPAG
jgi:hypothetical protein